LKGTKERRESEEEKKEGKDGKQAQKRVVQASPSPASLSQQPLKKKEGEKGTRKR